MRSAPHPVAEIVLLGGKQVKNPTFAFEKMKMQVFQCCAGETVLSLFTKSPFYTCAEKQSRSPPGVLVAVGTGARSRSSVGRGIK